MPVRRAGTRGFTLLEVLAALALATLFIAALSRLLGAVWFQAPVTGELVRGASLAQALLAEIRAGAAGAEPRSGIVDGYRWRVAAAPVPLAPARPAGAARTAPPRLASGARPEQDGTEPHNASAQLDLLHVTVEVQTPSGRNYRLEGLVARNAPQAER